MSMDVPAINMMPTYMPEARPARQAPAEKPAPVDVMKTEPPVDIQAILNDLTGLSATLNKKLSFSMNEKLDQVVVKVIDADTEEVIKEIPPSEIQHVHERIREVLGILFDEIA